VVSDMVIDNHHTAVWAVDWRSFVAFEGVQGVQGAQSAIPNDILGVSHAGGIPARLYPSRAKLVLRSEPK
jgi:hypothetical protein